MSATFNHPALEHPRVVRAEYTFGVNVSSYEQDQIDRDDPPQSRTSIRYYNHTDQDLFVYERSGNVWHYPARPANQLDLSRLYFKCRRTSEWASSVKFDATGLCSSGVGGSEQRSLSEAISKSNQMNPALQRSGVGVDYYVSMSAILNNGGSVYVAELDIVIATAQVATYHPHSPQGAHWLRKNVPGFEMSIEIIDPNEQFGSRYVNIDKVIYRVKSSPSIDRPAGIYISLPPNVASENNVSPVICLDFKDEAKSPIPLYKTIEEAMAYGDELDAQKRLYDREVLLHKQRVLEAQAALEAQKIQFAKEKQAAEEKAFEEARLRDQHEAELKRQLHEAERQRRLEEEMYKRQSFERDRIHAEEKLRHERSTMRRKDLSELIKWVPTVIAACVAIYFRFSPKPV